MGSAAAYHLARRGAKVLGIDRFEPPHTLGSSHGETRVIREAYFEHPVYVPFVQRAYHLWAELERDFGEPLYRKLGGLMIGHRNSTVATGAIRSATEHRLPCELLDAAAIRQRHPALSPDDTMVGVLEPRAGVLYPERCISAHLRLGLQLGAEWRLNTVVNGWTANRSGVSVNTSSGEFEADRLVLAAGPWMESLLPSLRLGLKIERQVLLWFQAKDPPLFTPERLPIHLWEYEPGKMFYGFPDLGNGVKVAFHHQGEEARPEDLDRTVREADISRMREQLSRFIPSANGPFLRGAVCLYTNTRDDHFVLDAHPGHENVFVASPCSGHGFKFASAIGEALADLALGITPALDLSLFACERLLQVPS